MGTLGAGSVKQGCREGSGSKTNETHFAILPRSPVAVIFPPDDFGARTLVTNGNFWPIPS